MNDILLLTQHLMRAARLVSLLTKDDLRGSNTFMARDEKIITQTGVEFAPTAEGVSDPAD